MAAKIPGPSWRQRLWWRLPVRLRAALCGHHSLAVDKVQPTPFPGTLLFTLHCRRCGKTWLPTAPVSILRTRGQQKAVRA